MKSACILSLIMQFKSLMSVPWQHFSQDKRLFQCGSKEAGLVKYDKYTCKKISSMPIGYNKNTRYKIHNKQLAMYNKIQIAYCSGSWPGRS